MFSKLQNYTYVVFYEKQEDCDYFSPHIDENSTFVDVSMFPELKDSITKNYGISKYPAMYYRGGIIYFGEEVEDKIDQIDNENLSKYKAFLKDFILKDGITIFIKGTIKKPFCKYTKQLLEIFKQNNISNLKDFDIFTDNNLKHYLKTINNWSTFPMVYVNGNFIGGLDKTIEKIENGAFFSY